MDSPFKKSSINEMCKQISSAPVIFRKLNNEECLAFYNNKDVIQATKLYILFPGTTFPKYLEGNDLYNLRDCIIHNVTAERATELYNQICRTHKVDTVALIRGLINTAPKECTECCTEVAPTIRDLHTSYNKKHACAWVVYKGLQYQCYVKDLNDRKAAEVILEGNIEYDVTFDQVWWAATISSKEFTALKIVIRKAYA